MLLQCGYTTPNFYGSKKLLPEHLLAAVKNDCEAYRGTFLRYFNISGNFPGICQSQSPPAYNTAHARPVSRREFKWFEPQTQLRTVLVGRPAAAGGDSPCFGSNARVAITIPRLVLRLRPNPANAPRMSQGVVT